MIIVTDISLINIHDVSGRNGLITARRSYASAVLEVVILSVCPSVRYTRVL